MKKRFKKIFVLSLCLLGTFCLFLLKQNNKTNVCAQNQNIPIISTNLYHVTWIDELSHDVQVYGEIWGFSSFYSNGLKFNTFTYDRYDENGFSICTLHYDNMLVYFNGWLEVNYRVMSFASETDFIRSTEDFVDEYESETDVNPFTIGYNVPIVLNNVYYRFTNPNPVNNTGNDRIWLDFYTTYFIPFDWQDSSGSFSQFEQPRNFWNNLYVSSDSIDYCYSFYSEYGLETTSFLLLNNNEWSQNGGKGIPQDQVIRIADIDVNYDTYVFLVSNGYFGTYSELIYTPTDPDSFGALVKSIANTPIEILQSLLDINMLGVNLFSVFCGIITIFLVIFVIKRIT